MTTSREMLEAIVSGENADAKEIFNALVGERIKAAMDQQFQEIGNQIFSVEESEQIDELSTDTMSRYIQKSSVMKKNLEHARDTDSKSSPMNKVRNSLIANRKQGIHTAVKKILTKEEEELAELMSKGDLDKVDVDSVKDPVDRGRAFVLKQAAKAKGGERQGLIHRQQQYKKNAEPIRKAAKDRGEI